MESNNIRLSNNAKGNKDGLMKRKTAESLIGRTWNELSDNQQEMLTKRMAVSMDNIDDHGNCIIEFSYSPLRIYGRYNDICDRYNHSDVKLAKPFQNATIYSGFDLDEFYRENEMYMQPISGISGIKEQHKIGDKKFISSISKFTIFPLSNPINGIVAVASVTFYNTLTINGITINEGKNGLYVKMPQKRTNQGNYIDVAHPLSTDGRRNINETLLSGYRSGIFKQEFVTPMPKNIIAQNSVKYPPEYGNSLARLDIVVDDMVVHNAKIIKSNDVPRLFMPSYKAKNGNYTSICSPASKEAFAMFNNKALEEFNTEYTFRKFNDSDVANLKESDINIQNHKNDKGENIVKFKAEDLQKVNAIVQQRPTVAPKMS